MPFSNWNLFIKSPPAIWARIPPLVIILLLEMMALFWKRTEAVTTWSRRAIDARGELVGSALCSDLFRYPTNSIHMSYQLLWCCADIWTVGPSECAPLNGSELSAIFILFFSCRASSSIQNNITNILDALQRGYDKRVRPNYGGKFAISIPRFSGDWVVNILLAASDRVSCFSADG